MLMQQKLHTTFSTFASATATAALPATDCGKLYCFFSWSLPQNADNHMAD